MRLSYQYRLLLTTEQKATINRWREKLRCQYNYLLRQRFDWWEQNRCWINTCPLICHLPELKEYPSYYTQKRSLTTLKKERPWYNEIHSQVLQDLVKRVDLAMSRFTKGDINGNRSGKPRFKNRVRYRSFTYAQASNENLNSNKLFLPKIGWVKIILHRPIPEGFQIKTITITKKADGFYASLSLEDKSVPSQPENEIIPTKGNSIAIDLGVEKLWTCSDGELELPRKHFRTAQQKLANIQRKKEKRKLRSRARRKLARKEASIHQKVARQRKQWHNESANKLLNKNIKVIFVEDLKIKNLTKRNKPIQDENGEGRHSHGEETSPGFFLKYLPNKQSQKSGLTKSILDCAWGQFLDILSYKAENAGMKVIKVNPKLTSQVCSCCNSLVLKELSDRVHFCDTCNLEIDRDLNAAINIKKAGLDILPAIKRSRHKLREAHPIA